MTSPSTTRPHRARRDRRPPPTLVVAGVGAAVVALAGLLVPAAGHELGLSLSRQPGTWTELYFTDAGSASGGTGCRVEAGEVATRFTLVSHEASARELDYRVVVRPADGGASDDIATEDTVSVGAGGTATVSASLRAASDGEQRVVVTVPSTGAEITARCGGAGS